MSASVGDQSNTGGNRPRREKKGKPFLNTLQIQPGLLRGICGNNPPRGAQGRKGDKDIGWGLGTGWWEGVEAEEEATENTKEGRRAIGGSNSTLLQLQRGPLSVPGPSGEQEGRGPRRRQLHAVLAARMAPAASWRENGPSWLQKAEGWCFFLFSEDLEKTEPNSVNLARSNFLPQGKFFPVLGKHTWLEFSSPGPGAQSFLPADGPWGK